MRRRDTMTLIHPALFFLILAYSLGAQEPPAQADTPLSGPVKGAPIKRYGVVDQGMLSRSSRPTAAGYTWLRQEGVKSLVNFTDEDPGDTFFKELGFESHLWLPIVDGKPPSDAQVEQFLSLVRDSQNWPAHMHCAEGESRAGLMAALVRYAIDGWPLEKALEEAKLYRKGKSLRPKYVQWLTHWAASHPPGGYRPVGESNGRKHDAR
jgi:protein tyrosine/serine phosphatase